MICIKQRQSGIGTASNVVVLFETHRSADSQRRLRIGFFPTNPVFLFFSVGDGRRRPGRRAPSVIFTR